MHGKWCAPRSSRPRCGSNRADRPGSTPSARTRRSASITAGSSCAPSRAAARRKRKLLRNVQTVGPLARNRGFESISLHQRVGRTPNFPRASCRRPDFLREFELVATIGAGRIVGQHSVELFELVINLGGGDEVALAGEKGGHPPDRASDLIDLRVQQDARIAPSCCRAEQVQAHRPCWGRDVGALSFGHFP